MRVLTRREFLAGSAIVGGSALLAACTSTRPTRVPGPEGLRLSPDNPGIAPGLSAEDGPLRIFNWDGYIRKRVLSDFGHRQRVDWEYETFFDVEEALSRLDERFDVAVVPGELVPMLARAARIQPLNHRYLSGLDGMWPEATRTESDPGLRYSLPYTVAKLGIAWWADRLGYRAIDHIGGMATPYDFFWDERYRGRASFPNDYRAVISMALLRRGELETSSPEAIERARDDLVGSAAGIGLEDPAIWLAWSGDVMVAPGYLSIGLEDGRQLHFWSDPHRRGILGIDSFVVPRTAPHPVLAHLFLAYMLEPGVAGPNQSWVGYRQPITASLELPGRWLRDTVVTRADLRHGYLLPPLDAGEDRLWRQAWAEVRAALG